MNDSFLLLSSSIRKDSQSIAAIYKALDAHPLSPEADHETLIVIGYHLHNLYNAFENIFQNVATVFENSVEDSSQWHAQLLERMRLDVLPLRPALIDNEAYEALDELRRFRHLFRHAYGVKLDPQRLKIVLDKAQQLQARYPALLQTFLDFLSDPAQR